MIIGAGTGGVAAALAAAERGLSVILTDELPIPGGQLTSQGVPPDEHQWIEEQGAPASYRAFRQQVRAAYAREWKAPDDLLNPGACGVSRICHAPSVATSVLLDMLSEHGRRIRFLPLCVPEVAGGHRDHIDVIQMRSLVDGSTFHLEGWLDFSPSRVDNIANLTDQKALN